MDWKPGVNHHLPAVPTSREEETASVRLCALLHDPVHDKGDSRARPDANELVLEVDVTVDRSIGS